MPKSAYFSGDIIGESAVRYEDQIGTEITHNYEVLYTNIYIILLSLSPIKYML